MASAEAKFVMNNQALDGLLRGPSGPIYTDMIRRASILQKAASMQIALGDSENSGPSGHLKNSIVKRMYSNKSGTELMSVWVGSTHPRALIYHEGTSPHTISARGPGPLHFRIDGAEVWAFSVQHPGTAPNRYLLDNLSLITQGSGG